MGFVEGGSLAAQIQGGPLPPRQAAGLVEQAARAVDYALRRGIGCEGWRSWWRSSRP
jgi:hypothetical protein